MSASIRHLDIDEIPLIGTIDRSEEVEARYACQLNDDGWGISLTKVQCDPPEFEANWGRRELDTRFNLWRRNMEQEGAVFHGAFVGDRLVGVVFVVERDGATAEIGTLHIDYRHRRKGVGSALVAHSEAQARQWGCKQIFAYTSYKARALEFYRAKGYRIVGIQDPMVATKNFDMTVAKSLHA